MNIDDPQQRAVFFEVHNGLPRAGPGNRSSLEKALELAGTLPTPASVLDLGCGPGQQTLYLAEALPGARIVAIDNHPAFVDELTARAAAAGLSERVEARVGDMASLDLPAGSFDLVWSEGAAYLMGFRAALEAWKPLLKPRGRIALTEAVWLKPDPPPPVRKFWQEYPAMADMPTRGTHVAGAGYRLLGDFVLPAEAWWQGYYSPMEARLAELKAKYDGDSVAESVLAECQEEIECFRRYHDFYSYGFFVMAV